MRLRPYQQEAVTAVNQDIGGKSHQNKEQFAVVRLPTGSGKSAVIAELATQYSHVIAMAPSRNILDQLEETIAKRIPSARMYTLVGSEHKLSNGISVKRWQRSNSRGIVFSTTQTFVRRLSNPRTRERMNALLDGALILVDESHWAINAQTGNQIIDAWRQRNCSLVGFTATPVSCSQQRVVYTKSFAEMVEAEVLARPLIEDVQSGVQWNPFLKMGKYPKSPWNNWLK